MHTETQDGLADDQRERAREPASGTAPHLKLIVTDGEKLQVGQLLNFRPNCADFVFLSRRSDKYIKFWAEE